MPKQKLVLLPGYDGDGTHSFGKLKKYLSKNFSITVIDFPYIRSEEKAYTLDELVDYVHAHIKKLEKPHLIGFSMGGFVGARYAERYLDQVGSLTLISSSPVLTDTYIISLLAKIGGAIVRQRALANIFSAIYCSPAFKRLLKRSPLPVPRVHIPYKMGYSYFGTLGNVIWAIKEKEYLEALSEIAVPKKALLFEDDMSFPANIYKPWLEKYGFHVSVRPQGGHATGEDYWEQVAKFLQQKTPPRRGSLSGQLSTK